MPSARVGGGSLTRGAATIDRGLALVWRAFGALLPVSIVLPLVLQSVFARLRPGSPPRLFEFLSVTVTSVLLASAAWALMRIARERLAWLPMAGFLIVMFAILQRIGYAPVMAWDFQVYMRAGDAMRAGETPYPLVNPYYTYPPAFVQALAAAATGAE